MHRRGFTILELLVVMAIIGILAAIGLASYPGVQQKARDARRKSDLASLARGMEMFYNDYGRYPVITAASDMGTSIPAADLAAGLIWGHPWIVNNVIYMSEIPSDPNINNYRYHHLRVTGTTVVTPAAGTNANGYWMLAHIENEEDAAAARTAAGEPGFYTSTDGNPNLLESSCNNRGCNYILRSPNAPMPLVAPYP